MRPRIRDFRLLIVCIAVWGWGPAPLAAQLTFSGLATPTGGASEATGVTVTGAGTIVVGFTDAGGVTQAARWVNGVRTDLGDLADGTFESKALAISADGSTIVGYGRDATGQRAAMWNSGGISTIGDLGGAQLTSTARGVSADGSQIVGVANSMSGPEAFVSNGTTMSPLGDISGDSFSSAANGISADGSVIVGFGTNVDPQAVVFGTSLLSLGTLGVRSEATAVSADGSVLVGNKHASSASRAFYSSTGGPLIELELAGATSTMAFAVSGDGSTIVGSSRLTTFGANHATVWINGSYQLLADLINSQAPGTLTGWQLNRATSVSADGLTIAGVGTFEGNNRAWSVTLTPTAVPEPGTLLLAAVTIPALAWLAWRRRPPAAPPAA